MKSRVERFLDFFENRPLGPSCAFLIALAVAHIPLVVRIAAFCDSKLSWFPDGLSEKAVLGLGWVCDIFLGLFFLLAVIAIFLPLFPLFCRRFKLAGKMFLAVLVSLWLAAVVLFLTGRLFFAFGLETQGIENSSVDHVVSERLARVYR